MMAPGQLEITLGLWLLMGLTFVRALFKGRLQSAREWVVWTQYLLCLLAFSMWGPTAEQAVDQWFEGVPLALFLKFVCVIGTVYLFLVPLRRYQDEYARYPMFLLWLAPVAFVSAIMSFVVVIVFRPPDQAALRYIVIGTRDAITSVYLVAAFVPGNLRLARLEQVPTMRLKYFDNLLLCLCFMISTVGSVGAASSAVTGWGDPQTIVTAFQPIIYVGVIFFIPLLLPHRWLGVLFLPARLVLYFHLKRLEAVIAESVSERQPAANLRNLLPHRLEMAIYQTTIFILDHYHLVTLKRLREKLVQQIDPLVDGQPEYPVLVDQLARVRY